MRQDEKDDLGAQSATEGGSACPLVPTDAASHAAPKYRVMHNPVDGQWDIVTVSGEAEIYDAYHNEAAARAECARLNAASSPATTINDAVIESLNRHVKQLKSVIENGQAMNNEMRRHIDEQGRMLVAYREVAAPPPSPDDYQVSAIDAPDFDIAHFSGGVDKIERRGSLLIFSFAAGGRICVPNPVTYHAPETH